MRQVFQDLRYAFRRLSKAPAFTTVAVLTLAVAIGVNSAVFAIVNELLLRKVVPVRPDEVVNVFTSWKDARQDYRPFSYAEYEAVRDSTEVFADAAAMQVVLVGTGESDQIRRSLAALASHNFLRLAGVEPVAGRFFTAEETRPGADRRVAVASHPYWQRLGSRADFVGSTMRVNGQSYTVVGITPPGYSGLGALVAPDIWLPLGVHGQLRFAHTASVNAGGPAAQQSRNLNVVARLRPGLTRQEAEARLPAVAQRLTALQAPATGRERHVLLQTPSRFGLSTAPMDEGPVDMMGLLLMSMAALVLVIASLNLANLLLARGATRRREIAIRLAVGANRWRVVRQLLAEGLLLALAGGALGLTLSVWTNDLLVSSLVGLYGSLTFSPVLDLTPNTTVLSATLVICLLATLLFSLGPALRISRPDLIEDLKRPAGDSSGRAAGAERFFAGRNLLMMGQIALSLVLLFAGGLFLRAALAAGTVALGFDPAAAIVTELDYGLGQHSPDAARRSMQNALQQARALPGVSTAALTTMIPYSDRRRSRRVQPADAPAPGPDQAGRDAGVSGLHGGITPGYFQAIGVRLLRGRDFTEAEAAPGAGTEARVAIVDQRMAEKLYPGREALGQHLRITRAAQEQDSPPLEIVGVVASHRNEVFGHSAQPRVFLPLPRAYDPNVHLVTRIGDGRHGVQGSDVSPVTALIPALRAALGRGDAAQPILTMQTFDDHVDRNVGLWIIRLGAVLFGVLGGIALLLAAVGVYGVRSFAVARRTRELGLRMALGAQPGQVFALVIRQAAAQTACALAAGTLLALAAGQALSRILYRVSPWDPLVLLLAALVLACASLLAGFLPARRATRIDPMVALRRE